MRKYTSQLFTTACTNTMYKVEHGKGNYDTILTWKVLRWAIIPAAILTAIAMMVYFIIDDDGMHLPQDELFKQNQKHDFELDNDVITLDVSRVTYHVSNPDSASPETTETSSNKYTTQVFEIEQEKEIVLTEHETEIPNQSEDTDDIVTSESKPATLSNRLRISTVKPNFRDISTTFSNTGDKGSISFVDKLLSNFDSSKSTEKVVDDMDEFLKEDGRRNYPQDKNIFYRRPNGHKYGEYQAPPSMNHHHMSTLPPPAVSPTLPSSRTTVHEVVSPQTKQNESETLCQSPSLYMCQGMLPWDLTAKAIVPGISSEKQLYEALPYLQVLAGIGCSPRARQFLCSLLEPECRSVGYNTLPPCRKACKAVAEECADIILEEDGLTSIFNCDIYPDLDNPEECVNLAKGPECYGNEFRCPDGTCIPQRWACNNVRDCASGADEINCTHFNCSEDKFRCKSDSKCIPQQWKCDTHVDCEDGSDELNCPKPVINRDSHHDNDCPKGLLSLRCVDGRCIAFDQICDNVTDCSDGSDESSCFP